MFAGDFAKLIRRKVFRIIRYSSIFKVKVATYFSNIYKIFFAISQQQETKFDGEQMIVDVVVSSLMTNKGGMRDAIKAAAV